MPQSKPLPSQSDALEHLRYDPDEGLLRWVKRGPGRTLSSPVGWKHYRSRNGEPQSMYVSLQGKVYPVHRLAWLMVTGDDPGDLTIDHINRDPFDNRWVNLRLADQSLQMRNRNGYGKSRHKGVTFHIGSQKWHARAWVDAKLKFIGSFSTEDEAAVAAAPYFIH